MSNFTPLVKKEYDFENDKVVVTFSRLKRKHMIKATPYLSKLKDFDAEQIVDNSEQSEAANDLFNSIIDSLPDYVKSVEGLNDVEGKPISIKTIAEDFYFMRLAMLISIDMIKESSPKTMEGND